MSLWKSKITRGGQITLSKEILKELDLNIGDYVMFKREYGKIFILPAELVPKGKFELVKN